MQGVGRQASPEEHAQGEEAHDGANDDEDGAGRERGCLHEGRIGGGWHGGGRVRVGAAECGQACCG